MDERLNKRVLEMKDEIVSSTQQMIRIKSVETEKEEGKPFGPGIDQVLNQFLELGKTMGMTTSNVDGYAGHIEIGQGDEIVGILCHLDVVPEGSNWTYPPYAAEIHDHKIFGRGTIDNKGPAVAALYAMKAVQDTGIKLNKRVRLILGTDEESGWEGLTYYLKKEETPDLAFSPDAEFPVIHAEKGILIFKLKGEFKQLEERGDFILKTVTGGNAPNMVPDYCEAVLATEKMDDIARKLESFREEMGAKLELEAGDGEIVVKSYGVSAHGSMPKDGVNAISQLMLFLAQLDLPEDDLAAFLKDYTDKIGMDYYGESIGCDFTDEVSGRLIFNVGMIDLSREKAEITVNIRYPVTYKQEQIYTGIRESIKDSKLILEEGSNSEPLYVPKDDPLVKKLMKVYQEITGDKSEPIAIGGGTYARAIEKAVAFGALFPGQPELAHQKDEHIAIDDLIKNSQIYANAIVELAE